MERLSSLFPGSQSMPIPRALILTATLLALAGAVQAASISGTVTDSAGSRLRDMTVVAYDPAGILVASASTNSQGRYTLGVQGGSFHVLAFDPAGNFATRFYVDAPSFEDSLTITLGGSESRSGVDFALTRGGIVAGRVTSTSGAPLAGVTVAAYNLDGSRRGFTGTNGAGLYSLLLPPGIYKLAAFDGSGQYATGFFDDQPTFQTATEMAVSAFLSSQADFGLALAARVSGTLVDATGGAPLAGRIVTAYTVAGTPVASVVSNTAGQFTLSLPAGVYKLIAEDPVGTYAPGFFPAANSFERAEEITLAAGESLEGLAFPLTVSGLLSGSVVEAGTGAPLKMSVAAYNLDGTLRALTGTDSLGRFLLLLPPGDYKLAAYDELSLFVTQFFLGKNNFPEATPSRVLRGAETSGVDFMLTRGVQVSGRVRDASNGLPLMGISVAAYDGSGALAGVTRTGITGNWAMALLPGQYRFAAFDPSLRFATSFFVATPYFSDAAIVELGNGNVSGVSFELNRGRVFTGRVQSMAGEPLADIVVLTYDLSGRQVSSTMTDGEGRFSVVVSPGTYKLAASDPQRRYASCFYENAYQFADATPIVVSESGPVPNVEIRLTRHAGRKRAVGRPS